MISAAVILFNPTGEVAENIKTYIKHVDRLFVVDNSALNNEHLFSDIGNVEKIKYLPNYANLGIATALNMGCRAAIEEGFIWLLTMDQDSSFTKFNNDVKNLLENSSASVALFYPTLIINGEEYDYQIKENGKPIVVMTSGNLINLDIYSEVKGYEDQLFIDYVDIDFCLKLHNAGYVLKHDPNMVIKHELGVSKEINLGFRKLLVTNHNTLRRYYITRNRFYTLKKFRDHKTFYNLEKNTHLNDFVKIVLFEDDKINKLKMMYAGYTDFKNNKFFQKR